MKSNKKFTDRQQRESDFFNEEYSNAYDSYTENQLVKELTIDVDKKLSEYEDRYKDAYSLVNREKGLSALDLGCGSGQSSTILAKLGYKVDATDISNKAIEIAKRGQRLML